MARRPCTHNVQKNLNITIIDSTYKTVNISVTSLKLTSMREMIGMLARLQNFLV